MSKVRYGMVGGGPGAFIGNVHRMAAALGGEIELVCGAFSRDSAKSQMMGRQLGLPGSRVYTTYEEMFAKECELPEGERMEFVSIVTPNITHYPIAMDAIKHGFHVFCEKPATSTLEECRSLQSAVKDSGLLFGLAHAYIAYPMVIEARERVRQGEIGKVKKVVVEYSQGWLAEINSLGGNKQADWRLDPKQAGASCCMGDIGIHAANLSEFISGVQITSLLADIGHVVSDRQLDDDCSVFLRFSNQARGVLIASQISIGEENNLNIKVYGDNGSLHWCQQEPNSLVLYKGRGAAQILRCGHDYLSKDSRNITRTPPGHPGGYIEAFANLYQQFASSVAQQRQTKPLSNNHCFVCGIDGAVRGMAIIDAVLRSNAANNQWVNINEQ